jgi:hypothetical protein
MLCCEDWKDAFDEEVYKEYKEHKNCHRCGNSENYDLCDITEVGLDADIFISLNKEEFHREFCDDCCDIIRAEIIKAYRKSSMSISDKLDAMGL